MTAESAFDSPLLCCSSAIPLCTDGDNMLTSEQTVHVSHWHKIGLEEEANTDWERELETMAERDGTIAVTGFV